MSPLLDNVTLENWQDVASNTLSAAKQGDAQTRAWLGLRILSASPQAKP